MKIQCLSDVFVICWKFHENFVKPQIIQVMNLISRKKREKKMKKNFVKPIYSMKKIIWRKKFKWEWNFCNFHTFSRKNCFKNCICKNLLWLHKITKKTWLDYSLRFQNSANHISRNITIRIAKVGKPVFLSNSTWHTFVVWKIWQNVTFNIH